MKNQSQIHPILLNDPPARRSSHSGSLPRVPIMVVLFALTFAAPLAAQNNTFDFRFFEINDDGDRTYHNFLYSRVLGSSKFTFEAVALFLPQFDYHEFGVGIGRQVAHWGDVNVSLIGYFSTASDDEYFQPALFALDIEGKLTGSFFVVHYLPLSDDGIQQWTIDPIEIQYNCYKSLSIGLSGYFYRPHGGSWFTKIGPKLSIADKWGASEVALRKVNEGGGVELQFRRIFVF